MMNHPWEYHLDTSPYSSYIWSFKLTPFTATIFQYASFFLLILNRFLHTPLHGLVFYSYNYPLCLFTSYFNHAFVYLTKLVLLFILCINILHINGFASSNYYISLLQNTLYTAEYNLTLRNSKPGLSFFLKL